MKWKTVLPIVLFGLFSGGLTATLVIWANTSHGTQVNTSHPIDEKVEDISLTAAQQASETYPLSPSYVPPGFELSRLVKASYKNGARVSIHFVYVSPTGGSLLLVNSSSTSIPDFSNDITKELWQKVSIRGQSGILRVNPAGSGATAFAYWLEGGREHYLEIVLPSANEVEVLAEFFKVAEALQ